MAGREEPGRARRVSTSRMEAFSDGVFAIAITILVLELSVPAASEEDLLSAIVDQWPSYMAYLISFTTIGVVWVKHTVITDLLRHTDAAFLRLNLALLLVVSFLPFPTRLMSEYLQAPEGAERVAVVFYGVVLLAISLLLSALWRYSVAAGLLEEDVDPDERAEITTLLTPSLAFYAATILLGLVAPKVAVVAMLGVALLLAVPGSAIRRALRHAG